ncbi:MAG: PilZ domain-containing protein [Oscillospiraceae bacterium]|jgi:c-di-GMP-binding flagellar brake protein YcgR|nr:PilZ domain-containing protein [Oscillospiraceae bacterium]
MDTNRRAYKRDICHRSNIEISLDSYIWHKAVVFDISAGGLKIVTNIIFDVGEDLWFNLDMPEFLSKSQMKIKGTIRRQEDDDEEGMFVYGVSFKDLSESVRIGIDENILLRERMHKKRIEYSE